MKKSFTLVLIFTVSLVWGSMVNAENTADETVRISATDTTSGKLADKLAEGSGINIDNLVTGINEKLTISAQDKLSTKGDLLTNSGSGDTTLAVGTDGQVLVVDSAASNGIKWADSLDLSAPGPIGGTTPGTGDFTDLSAQNLIIKNGSERAKRIAFAITVSNNGSSIQHKAKSLVDPVNSSATSFPFPNEVTGLSGTIANTPLINSSTDFASGVGVLSSNKKELYFDWITEQGSSQLNHITGKILYNTTGTTYFLRPTFRSINVNGSAKHRIGLVLQNPSSSTTYNWDSGTIGTNKEITFIVEGWVKF